MYHCSEAKDSETRHIMCPRDVNTWCKYWQSQNNGTPYEEKKGVPETIKVLLRPIFDNLAKDELLAKCLHGKTQNNNEALNSLVWKRVPKDVFVGRYIVEMGVSSAVIHFNDGVTGMKQVFSSLELTPGKHFLQFALASDINRIKVMEGKSSVDTKKRRKHLRAVRKRYIDKNTETEGATYAAGTFS